MLWALAAGALLVGLNLLVYAIGSATGQPRGPASSSYATSPRGLAGWAELLQRSDHRVRRLREAPSDRVLDPQSTVIVLDPDAVLPAEARALARFARTGGQLVAGGMGTDWFRVLLPKPPRLERIRRTDASVLAPLPEVAGVRRVVGAQAAWAEPGRALPTLGRDDDVVMLVARVGRGRLVLLSDPAPLQNRLLGDADNAALGLAVIGGPRRTVVFAESYHGFGARRGLGALPRHWQWTLLLLGASGVVWVAAHVRRFGPPEEDARQLPPPRRAYVDALSATLARTRSPSQAAAPLQAAARARLARLASLYPGADPGDTVRAAERAGVPTAEARALTVPARDDADVLAAGRALARLNQTGRPR
jgi:hypothetical protein